MKEKLKVKAYPKKSKKIIIAWAVAVVLTIFIAFLQLYLWSQFVHRVN